MEPYYWDGRLDYLKQSVSLYYNDDYIEFLVEKVWKLDQPVDILDFGCGFGHLGLRLLPLLPAGSRYTGIDAGIKLVEHARELFHGSPYETEFIIGDVHDVQPPRKYDLAVCHAVLLHMNEPNLLMRKMIDSVKNGGKVIAFEPHWNGNHAGNHFEGIEQSEVLPLGQLQTLFERDTQRTGKDGNIGLKLPLSFIRQGLTDVQCRMSDKVNIYNPAAETQATAQLYEAMKHHPPGERTSFIRGLLERGMTAEEAERQYETESRLAEQFHAGRAEVYAVGMKITFGTVS